MRNTAIRSCPARTCAACVAMAPPPRWRFPTHPSVPLVARPPSTIRETAGCSPTRRQSIGWIVTPHCRPRRPARGAAVAAVVAFHLWPSAAPRGFLGVSLFFTLSGYLIVSRLEDERGDRNGRAPPLLGPAGAAHPALLRSRRWPWSLWYRPPPAGSHATSRTAPAQRCCRSRTGIRSERIRLRRGPRRAARAALLVAGDRGAGCTWCLPLSDVRRPARGCAVRRSPRCSPRRSPRQRCRRATRPSCTTRR